MTSHEVYKETLAAHGLGALDATDARALETHLVGCGQCRQELNEWEAIASTLALDSQPVAPSPELREKILKAVHAEAADAVRPPARVVPFTARSKAFPAVPAWAAIAASVVFLTLIASLFVLWRQNNAARQELARLSEEVREAQQQMSRQREAIEIVTAPGARMSELAGTKEMPGAHGMVAYDQVGHAILMAKGLPPPPAGKAYQLWFIAGGRKMPGKVFMTDASGVGAVTDQMPAEAMSSAVFAITLEPEKGVPAPTGAVYLISRS